MPVARKVVLCVFDGLRADMVMPALTPNIHRFAQGGVWYREARSVFPSMTRVATTSIATGAPPAVHGIVGNAFYFPQAARSHVLDTSLFADLALAEAATGGRFVEAETFADRLAAAGKSVAIVHSGSAGSSYLLNPRAVANRHWTFSVHGADHTPTPQAVHDVVARLGPLPPRNLPRFEETDYAARVLADYALPDLAPDLALVWFNEPDTSFHYKALGTPESLAVLAHVDAAFGRILEAIAIRPDADEIAVIAASDHGHISTSGEVALTTLLSEQGHATYKAVERRLDGAVISFTGGDMGEIRVLDGSRDRLHAIARYLAEQPFTGMLFSRGRNEVEGEIEGTFALSLVGLDHARAPELVYVLRSSVEPDPFGLPGLALFTGGVPVGGGMHGGLNRHELNTVLVLGGAAAVAPGTVSGAPAGIIDLAPTMLDLLGVPAPATMRGVSLMTAPSGSAETHETGIGGFRQRLSLVRRGNHLFPTHGERI